MPLASLTKTIRLQLSSMTRSEPNHSVEMLTVVSLRNVIKERLTAAAEEILGVFEQTLSVYEVEIDRQRKLLDIVLSPEIKLYRTELPQQHACTEEEEELCDQERSSSLDQEEPEPPQVKEEQEELCTSQEGEHLVLKQEDDFLKTSCTYERSDNSNGWSARLDPDQNQTAADSEPPDSVSCKTTISESERERPRGPEQISDHQPLFHTSHLADNKDCKGGNRGNAANPKKNTVSATYSQLKPSDRSFKCNICSEDFNLYTQLEVHKRTHTAEKPFICTVCGRGFSFSRYLRQHMITHSVERPYSCNTCWKSFRRFEHLQVHTRSHTGEKPYRCVYCEKAFSSRRALTKHVQLHTGEKPYSCGTWGELLRQEQKLRETSKEKSPPTTQPGRSKFLSSQRFL